MELKKNILEELYKDLDTQNIYTHNKFNEIYLKALLDETIKQNRIYSKYGQLASYIPILASANIEDIGVSISTIGGDTISTGEYLKKFTIQSISKVISLIIALIDNGEEVVFDRVSTESPDGPFNSIETIDKKLDNPMTNAGAITICSMIKGKNTSEKLERILSFTRRLSGNSDIQINNEVYNCEKSTGNRNLAIAYMLKDCNKIDGNELEILDLYLKQCSIEVNALDLSNIASVLANNGINSKTKEVIFSKRIAQIVKSVMVIFGMYNESGNYLMKVGLPSKSGVSGGIMAVVPNKMGIGIFSPALDDKGNSIVGVKILQDLSNKLDLHIV